MIELPESHLQPQEQIEQCSLPGQLLPPAQSDQLFSSQSAGEAMLPEVDITEPLLPYYAFSCSAKQGSSASGGGGKESRALWHAGELRTPTVALWVPTDIQGLIVIHGALYKVP